MPSLAISRGQRKLGIAHRTLDAGRIWLAVALAMAITWSPGTALAVTLAQTPLYLTQSIAPNIVVTLDDSGSMAWAYVPDAAGNDSGSKHFRSSTFNGMYYDPYVVYTPPVNASGATLTTSFTQAWYDGLDHSRTDYFTGSTSMNLSTNYQATVEYDPNAGVYGCCYSNSINWPAGTDGTWTEPSSAYYFIYDTSLNTSACPSAPTTASKANDSCYKLATVGTSGDVTPGTVAQQQQNFANWYSFYRTRNLSVASAASLGFANLDPNVRIAWQSLNTCAGFSSSCAGWDGVSHPSYIQTYSTNKTGFYGWVSHLPAWGGTPMRNAFVRAGQYYTQKGTNYPYADNPRVADTGQCTDSSGNKVECSCRRNFLIAMTDGLWNGSTSSTISNVDDATSAMPDGTSFDPTNTTTTPFAHVYADSDTTDIPNLADIAFYYWSTDLRSDLNNNLTPYMPNKTSNASYDYWNPQNDPATWQHMVTFTIGVGLSQTLTNPAWGGSTYAGGYPGIVAGTTSWPATSSNSPNNAYDLWHAALVSRGQFFSADNPANMLTAFNAIVKAVMGQSSTAAAIATNSTNLNTGISIYQALFDPSDWSGHLLAYQFTGTLGTLYWDAATQIPAAASRNILTWNGSSGVPFQWSNLTVGQQTALGSSSVLNYLRGDQSQEQKNGGSFRNRTDLLGDIVDSNPAYVSAQDYGYSVLPEGVSTATSPYSTYVANKANNLPVVYVGANDGMLHGFAACASGSCPTGVAPGREVMAYVPAAVYANLANLSSPTYSHQYYVDGSPTAWDYYDAGTSTWKTALTGTLGAGGQAVFALDTTNPTAPSVLWEVDTSTACSGCATSGFAGNLGNVYGSVPVGRFPDGNYYAVFGNGYNSVNGHAVLYLVQINNPSNVIQIDTGAGSSTTPDGMSMPSLVDINGDRVVDTIYAGDLLGNVWKFSVTGTTGSLSVTVANKSGGKAAPFYTALDPTNGNPQPITAPIQVGTAPSGASGQMIYFGTGSYMATYDPASKQIQTFYGLLDNGSQGGDGSGTTKLQQQTIIADVQQFGRDVRATSSNTVNYSNQNGWYLNMVPPSGTAQGERVVSGAQLNQGRVIFTSIQPASDPCLAGGASFTYELDAGTGGALNYSTFDLNGDGSFDSGDYLTYTNGSGQQVSVPVSGVGSTVGLTTAPTIINAGNRQYKLQGGSSANIQVLTEKSNAGNPQTSWRQIQ